MALSDSNCAQTAVGNCFFVHASDSMDISSVSCTTVVKYPNFLKYVCNSFACALAGIKISSGKKRISSASNNFSAPVATVVIKIWAVSNSLKTSPHLSPAGYTEKRYDAERSSNNFESVNV